MERALRAEVVMVAIALLSIHFESKKYRGPSKEKEKEVSTTRTKSSFSLSFFLLSGELSNSFPLLSLTRFGPGRVGRSRRTQRGKVAP